MTSNGQDEGLLRSPTNLKEAIDWILRVTNKDGLNGKPEDHCWCDLANGVTDLLEGVEHHLTEEETKIVKNIIDVLYDVGGTKHVKALIDQVASQLAKFIGWNGTKDELTDSGIGNKEDNKPRNYQKRYKSHYNASAKFDFEDMEEDDEDDSNDKVRKAKLRCAKILLGAIPLVFSGLSYLYYTFGDHLMDDKKGEANGSDTRVGQYMQRMGYKVTELVGLKLGTLKEVNGKQQMTSENNVFSEVFKRCGILEPPGNGNYAQYLEKLRTEAGKNSTGPSGQTTDTKHSLIILNTICSGYFRSLHTIDSIRDTRPRTPNTIREILYWLTSLPYCPIYRTLVPKVQEMIRRIGNRSGGDATTGDSVVTFYGSDWSGAGSTLTVSDTNCGSYLLGAALIAPMVLLSIQDTLESKVGNVKPSVGIGNYKLAGYTNKVSIHDLYANMQFYFSYPLSETQSYYLLQDCLVALYYQMYFLSKQCLSTRVSGEGWGYCKYGDGVKCDNISGWKCSLGGKTGHGNGTSGTGNTCGNGKVSPLQAFLTDCLKGFTCDVVMEKMKKNGVTSNDSNKKLNTLSVYSKCYPGFLDHRNHLPVGQECAVPMGFSGSFRKKEEQQQQQQQQSQQAAAGPSMIGLGIFGALNYYSNDNISVSGLYQITRCICSLTRRVPRSTGTLYGFFYGLGLVYGNKRKQEFKKALEGELRSCPGYRDPQCLMEALMEWTETDHIKNHKSGTGNFTLGSLYMCGDNKTTQNGSASCGSYLKPLTGSLYNSLSDRFCETYVSWIVHLSWRLQSGLKSLLDEFVKIDCEKSGCSSHCCKGGTDHGKDCSCKNVVDCVGVHGLFYRFGFGYNSPSYVAYAQQRKCDKFYQQLMHVLDGGLFTTLQTQLRNFIYSTRALFGVYIGVYWTAVMGYLLWSMTVNLDLMHIQSHWKSPSSYLVPLQRILADGSRNVKRVCTIGYFQEANGDRLLSQGISDVYL